MITINLLGEEKDRSASYAINALAFMAVLFLTLTGSIWIYTSRSLALTELNAEKDSKNAQNESLKKRTAEVEGLEVKQNLLKEKLGVIAQLKAKKQGPVRILDEISKNIPDKIWLTEISQIDDNLSITGVALDGQIVSDFMEKLRLTPYIKETDSVSTELIVEDDLKLQKFKFPAKLIFLKDILAANNKSDTKIENEKQGSK